MNAQRTLRRPVSCTGIGLHSGNKVTLSLKPAPADFGIRFQRADLGGLEIPATVTHLGGIRLATGLTREAVSVETVEHLLAALTALGIDNCIVELNTALRFKDEFVRHKILDAIGDLSLVGYPVIGHLVAHRVGHALHTAFASRILEEADAWRIVETPVDPSVASVPVRSPGVKAAPRLAT